MEQIRIFDKDYTYIRDESRDVAHREGYWHETIQCWLVDEQSVYIQKRSATKKDFPSLFDITAAGHIMAHETVEDSIREIKEELGIEINRTKLHTKDIVRDIIELPHFLDYEFANLFLYEDHFSPSDFTLQQEEVEGLYKADRQQFIAFCRQETQVLDCQNIFTETTIKIVLSDFVPHRQEYFTKVAAIL